jgi:hypothetical protein
MRTRIERDYPNLKNSNWKIQSPGTIDYQCIAWAACDTKRRWWPVGDPPVTYWPPNVPAEETVESFVQAFATIGYAPCSSGEFEFGFQKVALYVGDDGVPTHMARQHFVGRGWLSKIGDWEDIVHSELKNLEGRTEPDPRQGYGRVETYLKRSWFAAARFGLFQGWWAAFQFWLYRIEHR